MLKPNAHILLIEDDAAIADALQQVLAAEHYAVTLEKRGDTGLARARAEKFDVVITDLRLPGLTGLDLVRQLHAAQPRLPVILMTAHGTTDSAIEAMKFGAFDYLTKPFEMPEMLELVARAVAGSRLMSEPVALGDDSATRDAIVGKSRAMQSLYKEIGRVAATSVNVLLRGETGTGKELIARALYQHGDRAGQPFIAINCAAIPETLLESELFGHERGAFTGANQRRIGRFEQADQGTVFLDEIGDMPLPIQAKLLRVLQEKCLQRLGGSETIPVDVRVIAATHQDLEAMQAGKKFREDLFYRLAVVTLALPPLRERREDIPNLVRFFLRKYGPDLGTPQPSIQPEAVAFLQTQPWPGNVRELENVIRHLLLSARGQTLGLEHVQSALANGSRLASAPVASDQTVPGLVAQWLEAAQAGTASDIHASVVGAVEKELFAQAIRAAQGNQAKAARWLGVSRVTMREKLHAFGLHPDGVQAESGEETAG